MADDFTKAKPGTRLYSTAHGWGVVKLIHDSGSYPIQMEFKHITKESFTKTGQLYDIPGTPQVLFWDDPKIVPQPRPKTKVKRWIAAFYNKDGQVCVSGMDMYPTLYSSKQDAENDLYNPFKLAFVCEVEVYEESCDG